MAMAYCLLPIAYCLLPVAYVFAYCLFSLLPIAYCLLPVCLLPVAYCLFSLLFVKPSPGGATSLRQVSGKWRRLSATWRRLAKICRGGGGRNAGTGAEDHFDLSDGGNLHQGIE